MKTHAFVGRLVLVVLLAIVVLPGAAFAQGPGFYVGAGIGMSEIDWTGGSYADFDDTDTAVKAFVGYAFNKGFAIEAGYVDLGSYKLNPDTADPTVTVTEDPTAAYLAGIGMVPLSDRLALIAKIGLAQWNMDVEVSQAALSGSESGLSTLFGIGFQYDLKPVLLRIEYEQYQDIGVPTWTSSA